MVIASSNEEPQKSISALKPSQTLGRSADVKIEHFRSIVKCGQTNPLGLPFGSNGIGDEIEIAIQQAPHPTLHSIKQL